MSGESDVRKKRGLELDNSPERTEDAPMYADAETMAQRRIVRVVRQTSSASTTPSLGGTFKALSSTPPPEAQTLSTNFSFGAAGTNSGGNGAASKPQSFLFGEKAADSDTSAGKKFSFGIKNECQANDSVSKSGAETDNSSGGAKTSLFGEAFKFANGSANLFTDAKERLAMRESTSVKEQDETKEKELPEESLATVALRNAEHVAPSTGDVLASVPCKLYLFKSEVKKWVECGVGDAKIKRHELPTTEKDEKKFFYRLIVRDGYSLNAPLCSSFCLTNVEDTHIVFALPKENDKIATYFIKYTGQQGASGGAEFTRVLKDTLSLVKETSL